MAYTLFLTLLFSAASLVCAKASGSYFLRPIKPAEQGEDQAFERAQYALGKRLFNGKVELPDRDERAAAKQREPLAALQALLPKRYAKKKNLPQLAGRLTSEQLDALAAYVRKRFAK